jgi:hypothetical protein
VDQADPSNFRLGGQGQIHETNRRITMKKLFLAVALVVAFAAPAMAGQFPNLYATNADARSH